MHQLHFQMETQPQTSITQLTVLLQTLKLNLRKSALWQSGIKKYLCPSPAPTTRIGLDTLAPRPSLLATYSRSAADQKIIYVKLRENKIVIRSHLKESQCWNFCWIFLQSVLCNLKHRFITSGTICLLRSLLTPLAGALDPASTSKLAATSNSRA